MMKFNRIATTALIIGLLGGQTLWAGWAIMSGGLLERDARRLETARKSHVTDIERAFNVYTTQVDRANTSLTRNYEQIIRQYENRGDRSTVDALKKELEELTAGALKMPFPEEDDDKDDKEDDPKNAHTQLISWIGPEVVNAGGDRGRTAGLAEYNYVLLYYTAGWCGPCRVFTPQLVQFYNENRSIGKWEVVVVSGDRSEGAFYDYLRSANMPWAAVPYDRLEPSGLLDYQPPGAQRFPGVWPRMVVFDREGKALLNATGGSQSMLNEFRALLQRTQ